jgi:DNA recombination protein RmuC
MDQLQFLMLMILAVGIAFFVLVLRKLGQISEALKSETIQKTLGEFNASNNRLLVDEFSRVRQELTVLGKNLRDEISSAMRVGHELITGQVLKNSENQLKQLDVISKQWTSTAENHDVRMRDLQRTVDERLLHIEKQSGDRLEMMRKTVEEKLEGTLERRLGESFKMVGERLEQVQRGLGEMQSLANGVGDLKRVLTNVKSRGTWGEVQLAMLLEQTLTPDQYESNVKLGGNADMVEFAVKLPGREEGGDAVFLPIDSKFPQEAYQRLLDAQEAGATDAVQTTRRELESAVRVAAKSIRDKYIHPPRTTDFAVMFLPTEGLYAEILRIPGLMEKMQNEFRISIAGPTTLSALLSSLQMGFRTMAIQKRSGEVWKILGVVKSEFGKFGDILEGVQKKLGEASVRIEDASRKSRTIQSKLRLVQEVPSTPGVSPEDHLLGTTSNLDEL